MASWRNILNFEVIQEFIKKVTGVVIDEELKEKGFLELEKKYSDKIYEREATEIEQELIKIYLGLLEKKGIKVRKRIRIPFPIKGGVFPQSAVDSEYIRKFLQEYPELRKIIEEILDEDEDDDGFDDDDRISDMYI